MSKSLLADDREDYVFGALVKGATKLAQAAGKSISKTAKKTTLKNSKDYKNSVKELTTDNTQGAGGVWSKEDLKIIEGDDPESLSRVFRGLKEIKKEDDRQANELVDAGVSPESVKRILAYRRYSRKSFYVEPESNERQSFLPISSSAQDAFISKFEKTPSGSYRLKNLTDNEKRILRKVEAKYEMLQDKYGDVIGPPPMRDKPILIEHEAGKEPKAIGGLMNQSLLDSQDFNKDTGFPSIGRESSITAERGSPTTDFPGDQMKKSLLADERQPYVFGALAKLGTKLTKAVFKTSPKKSNADEILKEASDFGKIVDEKAAREGFNEETLNLKVEQAEKIENLLKDNFDFTDNQLKVVAYRQGDIVNYADALQDLVTDIGAGKKAKTQELLKRLTFKEFSKERRKAGDTGSLEDEKSMYKEYLQLFNKSRVKKQEGSLMVPPEMEGVESDMPADTYPNIPPEEMEAAEASQLPDEAMEDKHMEFVFEESLDDEEQSYLMNALEGDSKLSQIFDKVIATASEFTGAGEVEGPGTGVSDSIPARLSDGEFVFTDKATEQLGSDNLQAMMDDAERAYDGGMIREPAQEGGLLLYKGKDEDPLAYEKIAQDEIKKNMLRSNRAPSLNPG